MSAGVAGRVRPAGRTAPTADDEETGGDGQPGIELLGDDEVRERERDEAEREDARPCASTVTIRPSRTACRARPAGADQVGGDDGLAVAGGECVRSSPEQRHEEGDEDDAEPELVALDERLEAAAPLGRAPRRGAERRAASRTPLPGS